MNKTLQNLWHESRPFKKFIRSYLYMITHPKKCMRFINFASKVIALYGIDIEDDKDGKM